MKIVYCHCSVYNPGGMERVLMNKVKWLVDHGHEVMVITTDQQGRAPFYEFPKEVRMVDLGINYSRDNHKPLAVRIPSYLNKRRIHQRRLKKILMAWRPDVTVSLYPSESSFIPDIKDGSRKVLELHFNRYFRWQYGRKGLTGRIDQWRGEQDVKIASKFDDFVVLTEEDKGYWGDMPNISVIPNAAREMPMRSDCSSRRIIAVGRLDYQKGFDRLVNIWKLVKEHPIAKNWNLDIFGQGEWMAKLYNMIADNDLQYSLHILKPTSNIHKEYADSSMLVMTSRYEGFPMVMIEAMAAGMPVVTYDYKCGPREIITDGVDGFVVPEGDERAFADAILKLIVDDEMRRSMGAEAVKVSERYSEERVMQMWMELFNNAQCPMRNA